MWHRAMTAAAIGACALVQGCVECERRNDCAVEENCIDGACVAYKADNGGNGGGDITTPPPGGGTAITGEQCSSPAECVGGLDCVGGYCVGEGVLRVSMVFDGATDMDLHLRFPNGTDEIYYGHRRVDPGELDVDQCVGSPSEACPVGSVHVENIFFDAAPPSGQYVIRAHNFNGANSSNLTIEVRGLFNQTFTGAVQAASSENFENTVSF